MENESLKTPFISALLPVYNGELYLEESIQCILDQTYKNFELIIINDGSTDRSASIISQFRDSRIRIYEQKNQGLAATLNRGISLAKGEYIARQDQDDISLPQRFEKQVEFLETHPDYGMVGTWAKIWAGNNESNRSHEHPNDSIVLKFHLLYTNPFVHSSVMIRKSVFDRVGLYSTDKSRQPPEDYELWSRIAREFEIANIPEFLQRYREVPKSMSRAASNVFVGPAIKLAVENLAWTTKRSREDLHILDLAALTYRAFDKISARPDFMQIRKVILQARETLSQKNEIVMRSLEKDMQAWIKSVRMSYLMLKYGKVLGTTLGLVERLMNVQIRTLDSFS